MKPIQGTQVLVQAAGVQLGNSVVTPGTRVEEADCEAFLGEDHDHELNAGQHDEHNKEPSLDSIKQLRGRVLVVVRAHARQTCNPIQDKRAWPRRCRQHRGA